MIKLLFAVTMAVLALSPTRVQARSSVSHSAAAIERGHVVARTHCAQCHGIARNDKSPNEEAPPFERLAERYPVEYLAEALAEGIVVGHKDMPPFEFQPAEIEALIAYLGSLQREGGPAK